MSSCLAPILDCDILTQSIPATISVSASPRQCIAASVHRRVGALARWRVGTLAHWRVGTLARGRWRVAGPLPERNRVRARTSFLRRRALSPSGACLASELDASQERHDRARNLDHRGGNQANHWGLNCQHRSAVTLARRSGGTVLIRGLDQSKSPPTVATGPARGSPALSGA